MSTEDAERFDVLILAGFRGQQFTERAIRSLVDWLAFTQIAQPSEVHEADDAWTELVLQSDIASHMIFEEGPAPEPQPTFLEAVIGWGRAGRTVDYGDPGAEVGFLLEFRGCLFEWPSDDLLARLHQMLYLRPEAFRREHEGLPARTGRPGTGTHASTRASPTVLDLEPR